MLAIEGMKKRVIQVVNDSVLNQLYPKAIGCLEALRVGCIQEEEPEAWNNFLRELRTFYEGKRRDDFWQEIVRKNLTLIDSEESDDSTISPKEAQEVLLTFLSQSFQFFKKKAEIIFDVPNPEKEDDEVDDLFAMVE